MLKKIITYTDFEGTERTEEFYFNLSKGELTKMELMGEDNSLSKTLERISKGQKGKEIIPEFERIVTASFGIRSEDGKRFVKTPEGLQDFTSSAAYSELVFQLLTDADVASEFVRGIMPVDLASNSTPASTNEGKSTSQLAREASQAALQGHKPKTPAEPVVVTTDDKESKRLALQAQLDALNE